MNFISQNTGKRFIKKVTTTDGNAATVFTQPVADNEVGMIVIKAIGLDSAGVNGITGIIGYRYKKVAGTLTLGSVVNIMTPVVDTALSGGGIAAVASSNNIAVQVTGKASVNVDWNVIIERTASVVTT